MDWDGDFVVAWNSYLQDGSGYGVYAQRFNNLGAPLGAEFRVNSFTTSDQHIPDVSINARGDFAIVWSSENQDGSGDGTYLRQYDFAGNPTTAESIVSAVTVNHQTRPSIAMDLNGDFVAIWQDGAPILDGRDGSGYGVYAQRYVAPDQLAPMVASASFAYLTRQALVFGFSEDVAASLTIGDLIVQNLTTGAMVPAMSMSLTYSGVTNTATVAFPGAPGGILPDGNYRITLVANGISDPAGNPLDGDANGSSGGNFVLDFFVLGGDANRDRTVDITDLGVLATHWQQSPRNFAQGDFNYDTIVDITDLGILATNWQVRLLAPIASPVQIRSFKARFPTNAGRLSAIDLCA
jgi:hypothetical protein